MADIFISYSSLDKDIANEIQKILKKHGYSVFLDHNVLVPGENFSEKITSEIINSQVILILLSKNSQRSSWVQNELATALEQGPKDRVIPILLDSDAKNNWVWPLVADRKAVNIKDIEQELPKVIDRVSSIYSPSLGKSIFFSKKWLILGAITSLLVSIFTTISYQSIKEGNISTNFPPPSSPDDALACVEKEIENKYSQIRVETLTATVTTPRGRLIACKTTNTRKTVIGSGVKKNEITVSKPSCQIVSSLHLGRSKILQCAMVDNKPVLSVYTSGKGCEWGNTATATLKVKYKRVATEEERKLILEECIEKYNKKFTNE